MAIVQRWLREYSAAQAPPHELNEKMRVARAYLDAVVEIELLKADLVESDDD